MMLCLFMCVVMGGEMLLSAFSIQANAAEAEASYTNAYNDLLADKSFDPSAYPSKVNDFVIVTAGILRHYEITSILRPWSKDYGDTEAGGGNRNLQKNSPKNGGRVSRGCW